jgi:HEAT repeat protein
MRGRGANTALAGLALGLTAAVLVVSCVSVPPVHQQAANPADPYFLTNKYLADLRNGSNAERTKAAWELGEPHVKRTPEVVPALIQALKDPYPSVRANAAGALSGIGAAARPAESALREALGDPYGNTVLNAARALRGLNVPKQELIPPVRRTLSDEKDTTRVAAVRLLRKMGVRDDELLAVLADVLAGSDQKAQLDAFKELNHRRLKPVPKKISGPAIDLLKTPNDPVRMQAAIYLGNSYIPIPEAKQPLIDTLDDPSPFVVRFTARAVGNYGKSAQGAVPKLVDILEHHPDDDTRGEACQALGHIGVPRQKIARILVEVLSTDPGPRARRGAAAGLRTLKHRDAAVLEALKRAAAQDEDSSVRTLSEITYGQLKGKP